MSFRNLATMMRVASILFFTILILISAQDEPYFHSISVYVNGNPLILNFTEDEDYRTIATAFASENRLADLAGRCRQVEPSESNEWPECIVDSMVDDMRKAVTYDVATSAAHGQRSFETKKDREVSLIIVDDFLSQPDAMRLFGLSCQFAYKGNHPGQRTASFANLKAFRPIRRAVEELVGEKLPYWFASFQRSYSNDTDNGVHRDSGAYKYSAILYLTPGSPPQLGTSTWKHQATGLYGDPTTSDLARNNKTADALLRILEDDPNQEQYDEIDRIGNRFNRLLIFNSKLNHRSSQLGGLGSNLEDGRLILILFFNTQDRLGQDNSILYYDADDDDDESSRKSVLSSSTHIDL